MMGSGSVPRSPEQGPTQVRRTVDAGRTRRGTEALRRVRNADALRARNAELTAQLRAAALERINDAVGRAAGDVVIRQMGNFMRDLYPSYGVYEVLGRLGGDEFAALTTCPEYASRGAIVLRAGRQPTYSDDLPALSLSVGVAHFNPRRPVGLGELLENAKQLMYEHKRATRIASSEMTPHPV